MIDYKKTSYKFIKVEENSDIIHYSLQSNDDIVIECIIIVVEKKSHNCVIHSLYYKQACFKNIVGS